MRWLAYLIGLALGSLSVAAQAQTYVPPTPPSGYLPPSYDYLPKNISDAIVAGDVKTRVLLGDDSIMEPMIFPGVERPLKIEIPVDLAPGILPPLGIGEAVFVEPFLKPNNPFYVSDIITGDITQQVGQVCCTLTINM
jgi:hypothetical protein